jgi:hypothetical protein
VIRRLLLTALAPIAIASPAAAQQWRVDVQGGRIRSALDPSARGTESVVAGIGYEDPATAFRHVVNPGSIGQPKDGDPRAAFLVIENGICTLDRCRYPVGDTIKALGRRRRNRGGVHSFHAPPHGYGATVRTTRA